MDAIQKYQDLEIYQLANQLKNEILNLNIETSLPEEKSLVYLINKNIDSIVCNIKGGFECGVRKELIYSLVIVISSLTELESQTNKCFERKLITQQQQENLNAKAVLIRNKVEELIRHFNKEEIKEKIKSNHTTTSEQVNNTSKNNSNLQTPSSVIQTPSAAKPLGAYPHARKVGNLLFLSGIGSRRAEDNKIPGLELDVDGNIVKYDIALETHQVMANVKAVLEASGSSWDRIIDVTVFLTNMKKDFPIYNKIYAEYFEGVQACRTTVEVKSLPTPICIELKVVALIEELN